MAEQGTFAGVGGSRAGGSLRCAEAARAAALDPGGSAAAFDVLVLVERPLPWPADVGDAPDLAAVAAAATSAAPGRRLRLQAITAPRQPAPPGRCRLICYQQPAAANGERASFFGTELETSEADAPTAVASLVAGEGEPVHGLDVLICGHGARDRCCGSMGTRLALEVSERSMPGVRLWRTSHLGGHRFAPTAMVLPSGDVWANLDAATLEAVATRQVEPSAVLGQHRGWAALPSPALQLLDRYALGVEGWSWRERPHRSTEQSAGESTTWVAIDDEATGRRYEGLVARKRSVPLPACGGMGLGKPAQELELLAATQRSTSLSV